MEVAAGPLLALGHVLAALTGVKLAFDAYATERFWGPVAIALWIAVGPKGVVGIHYGYVWRRYKRKNSDAFRWHKMSVIRKDIVAPLG